MQKRNKYAIKFVIKIMITSTFIDKNVLIKIY